MIITILGSCRQDSLYNYFPVTKIKNALTFPHYSKETIQAIEFCSGVKVPPYQLTSSLFRTGILKGRSIDFRRYMSAFKSTDLFVIEIASRISYEYRGYYAHHILVEDEYAPADKESIAIRDLTDLEIEEDLLTIMRYLHPKKVLVVSHFYTRTHGKRYELAKLLKRLTKKYDIPFFDPVYETREFNPDDLFEREVVQTHLTKYGQKIMGQKYYEYIKKMIPTSDSKYENFKDYLYNKIINY